MLREAPAFAGVTSGEDRARNTVIESFTINVLKAAPC